MFFCLLACFVIDTFYSTAIPDISFLARCVPDFKTNSYNQDNLLAFDIASSRTVFAGQINGQAADHSHSTCPIIHTRSILFWLRWMSLCHILPLGVQLWGTMCASSAPHLPLGNLHLCAVPELRWSDKSSDFHVVRETGWTSRMAPGCTATIIAQKFSAPL